MNAVYQYRIDSLRVIDGDTMEVNVDLGFHTWQRKVSIRLLGINCPEKNTLEGKDALAFVQKLVADTPLGWILESFKPDKYGNRWDGRLYMPTTGKCLNDLLIETGHAKPFMVPK